ncbi:hypothetical protein [Acrocarpospora catenulata]|nr:hypothetical protein [Acrocarpospora catenulata]
MGEIDALGDLGVTQWTEVTYVADSPERFAELPEMDGLELQGV